MKVNVAVVLFFAANAAQAGPIGMRHTNGVSDASAHLNGKNVHRAEALLINHHGHAGVELAQVATVCVKPVYDNKADGIGLEALDAPEVTKSEGAKQGHRIINKYGSTQSITKSALGAHEDAKSEGAKHGHSIVINRVSTQSLTKRAPGASDVTKFNGGDKGFFSPLPIIKRAPGAPVLTMPNDSNSDNGPVDSSPLTWHSTNNRAHLLKMSLEQRENNEFLLRDEESELKSVTKRGYWFPVHWCWIRGETCSKRKRENLEPPASYHVHYIPTKAKSIGTLKSALERHWLALESVILKIGKIFGR